VHEMRPIATDDPVAWCNGQPVCQSVASLRSVETAKRIHVLFRVETPGGQGNKVFDGSPDPSTARRQGVSKCCPL